MWGDVAVMVALLLIAGATHGPVFGGWTGYVAVAGGVLCGAAVGVVSGRWRWNALETVLALVIVYLVAGGPLALPATTIAHVVPTFSSLQGLVVGSVAAWKDLLTLAPPASSFTGPGIVPWMSALVCSVLALTLLMRTRRPGWAIVPVVVVAVVGVLWGSQNAPAAAWLGSVATVIAALWYSWLSRRRRARASRALVGERASARGAAMRVLAGSAVTVLVAGAVSLVAASALTGSDHRAVLRDEVPPPLELSSYASPLTSYHRWMTEQRDTVLFTVEGLKQGDRVRLATLDTYNGVVMRVGDSADGEGFVRVGSTVTDAPLEAGSRTQRLTITIEDYTGYWMPGGGDVHRLELASSSRQVADSLYYSAPLQTAMTSRGVRRGDSYTVTTVRPRAWKENQLAQAPVEAVHMPADERVPEQVVSRQSDLITDASTPIKALRSMTDAFVSKGFYSDGTQAPSLASHAAGRMAEFLDPDALMVGDDEQYAVAMALVARSAGYPARVVVGFYPEQYGDGPLKITGQDAHAWVEVAFNGIGWVTFDPTPPRDKVPQTQQPKPRPNPRPQVIQPPVPPQEPEEVDADEEKQTHDEHAGDNEWLRYVVAGLKVAGGVGLVAAPFVIIVAAKAVRRRRRRGATEPLQRVTGAWDEVVDAAVDLRVAVPRTAGRVAQARALSAAVAAVEAQRAERVARRSSRAEHQAGSAGAGAAHGSVGRRRRWARRPRLRMSDVAWSMPPFGEVPQPGSLEAVARAVDGAVFGGQPIDPAVASQTWRDTEQALGTVRRRVGRWRRWRARVSPLSLPRPTPSQWGRRLRHRLAGLLAPLTSRSRRMSRVSTSPTHDGGLS